MPLDTSRFTRGTLAAVLMVLAASMARGQGVQLPPTIPPNSTFGTPPPVVFDGTIQPVDPHWDPYADPAAQPPALLPQDGFVVPQPGGVLPPPERLLQQIRLEYTYLARRDKADGLGINDIQLDGTIAVPFYYGVAPVLFTPGFGLHLWDGPDSSTGADLPSEAYNAFLDIGWRPQLTPQLSADLGIRPSLNADFKFLDDESLLIKGRALGILTASPQWQFIGGVIYLDRIDLKVLPAGGAIWTPDDCTRFEIIFPRPKLAKRLNTFGNTEWWWYVGGEIGGDTYTVTRVGGAEDQVDYYDLRVYAGLEWHSFLGYKGNLEFGYAFNRELDYISATPNIDLSETYLLRGVVTY